MGLQPTRFRCLEAGALALAFAAFPANAGTRLDDSLSPRSRIELQATWEHDEQEGDGAGQLMAIVGEVRDLEIRLDTAAWVGRNAEIYVRYPQDIAGLRLPSAMRIEWRTRGRFSGGVAIPGQRALIYRGRIESAVTGDFFDFTYRIDGRHFDRRLQFDPVFEIEPLH